MKKTRLLTLQAFFPAFFFPLLLTAQWFSEAAAGDPVTDNLPCPGASWNDLNADGYPDLLVTGFDVAQNNRIYLSNQDGTYSVLAETPFTQTPGTWGSVVGLLGDYDNDGDEDVMLCSYRNNTGQKLPLYLLVNQGAPDFELVADTAFSTPNGSYDTGSWVDYDLDGDLDFHAGAANSSFDRFYRNDEGTFNQLDTLSFLKFRSGFITAVSWVDLDEDGDLDLYVANYTAPNSNTFHKSMLMETGDPNYFVQTSIPGLTDQAGANIGFVWVDYDNDSDLDLYLNHFNAKDKMFRNDGDLNFTEITDQPMLDVVDYTNFNAWADFDNDGDQDLALAHQENSSKGRVYRNDGGTFTQLTNAEVGDLAIVTIAQAQAGGAADHDLDGDMDLFITNTVNASIGAPNFLFENEIESEGKWLKIKLIGVESNRNGYGSKVYVTAVIAGDTVRQMRLLSGGPTGHAFQESTLLHFGLGDAAEVLEMEVRWLSGAVDVCTGISPNQLMVVEEGDCLVSAVEDLLSQNLDFKRVKVFPNPGGKVLTCEFFLKKTAQLHWQLADVNGKVRLQDESSFQAGEHRLRMRTEDLAAGWYTLELRTAQGAVQRSWVKR